MQVSLSVSSETWRKQVTPDTHTHTHTHTQTHTHTPGSTRKQTHKTQTHTHTQAHTHTNSRAHLVLRASSRFNKMIKQPHFSSQRSGLDMERMCLCARESCGYPCLKMICLLFASVSPMMHVMDVLSTDFPHFSHIALSPSMPSLLVRPFVPFDSYSLR